MKTIIDQIRSGELRYCQAHLIPAYNEWLSTKFIFEKMDGVGLNLPNYNEEEPNDLQELEDWLAGSFRKLDEIRGHRIKTEAEYRAKLAKVYQVFKTQQETEEQED